MAERQAQVRAEFAAQQRQAPSEPIGDSPAHSATGPMSGMAPSPQNARSPLCESAPALLSRVEGRMEPASTCVIYHADWDRFARRHGGCNFTIWLQGRRWSRCGQKCHDRGPANMGPNLL
jgi:hypothetical protein